MHEIGCFKYGDRIIGCKRLKQPFSQVERDLDLQEILKLFLLSFKKTTRKKKVCLTMKYDI
jgi:hypothetical protein